MTIKHKYETTSMQRYAEKYWRDNDYEVELLRDYASTTHYLITKNGVSDKVVIQNMVEGKKKYMQSIDYSFELKCKIEQMKKELENN